MLVGFLGRRGLGWNGQDREAVVIVDEELLCCWF